MKIETLNSFDESVEKQRSVKMTGKCPFLHSEQSVKLTNFTSGKQVNDILHAHSKPIQCTPKSCQGAMMSGQSRAPGLRSKEELLEDAIKFQEQYHQSLKETTPDRLNNRINEIKEEVEKTGTYNLTYEELVFGAKLAWRNASRCIGRIQWNKLEVQDCRHITTTEEMFQALCKHLEVGTNEGNLKSMITVFPQRIAGRDDFRLWNPQLINYAGYLQEDGSVIGDPGRLQITRICQRLGWKGKGGRFDILPWVVSAPGEGAKFYEIPEELVLMVDIEHPKYPWFKELGIKWYALPAVADMMFDCGGLAFTAAPFNGWYMATEVGARNLCDTQRYNISQEVAERMGLDTSTPTTLWKDKVLVEVTYAVLYSFQKNKVTMVDHHTAAETFMKHLETEQKLRGGCPADWVWIVPPISGSATPVYHQEMICYNLKPSYEYQPKAWTTYKWPKNENVNLKYSFSSVAKSILLCVSMISKVSSGRIQATILYATETGKSETFARRLESILQSSFKTRVMCMEDYSCNELPSEDFLVIVASTFGSGEPPDNGKSFWNSLKKMKESQVIKLEKLRFAVFALGSSQYPQYCNFGKNVDKILSEMGGKRLISIQMGDELRGQEHSFNTWIPEVYTASCKNFRLEVTEDMMSPTLTISTWKPENFRAAVTDKKEGNVIIELSRMHNRKLFAMKMLSRAKLQASYSESQTLLVRLDVKNDVELNYEPGDHIAVFPVNPPTVVKSLVKKLEATGFSCDEIIQVESLKDGHWKPLTRLPPASTRTYLERYLDITSPPTSTLLYLLSSMATNSWDKYRLKRLSEVTEDYEEWKSYRYPNLAELLEEFPSIVLNATLLISELPLLQPRYYSISSSTKVTPREVHITLTLVAYRTQDNKGPIHRGVCSSFLDSFPEDEIPVFIRSAPRFHLPEDAKVPLIMIGAGSGIAPFRSFWQEREALHKKLTKSQTTIKTELGQMYLFFGCRQSTVDNIYEQETASLVRKGVLTRVFTALSREPGQNKCYVQHKLELESDLVMEVISKEGHIYVCGDAVMSSCVREVIQNILSKADSGIEIDDLIENGKYHEDVFGVLHRRS